MPSQRKVEMLFEKEDLLLLSSEDIGYTNSKGMKLIENRFHAYDLNNREEDEFELVFTFENIYYRVIYDVPCDERIDWSCKNPPQPFSRFSSLVKCDQVEPIATVSYRKIY
jgi:hypothetical protein